MKAELGVELPCPRPACHADAEVVELAGNDIIVDCPEHGREAMR